MYVHWLVKRLCEMHGATIKKERALFTYLHLLISSFCLRQISKMYVIMW